MVTRSHTDLFNRYRGTTPSLLSQQEDDRFDSLSTFDNKDQPSWFADVKHIESQLEELRRKMDRLTEITHELPSFSSSFSAKRKEIDGKSAELMLAFQQCNATLRLLGSRSNLKKEEISFRDNIKSKLAMRLQLLSAEYQRTQQQHLQEISGLQKKGMNIPEEDEFQDEKSSFLFGNEEMVELNEERRQVFERNKEVRLLARSILELNTLFMDLSEMVVMQGSLLDRIDQNLTSARDNVVVGVKNLEEAKSDAGSSTKCWLFALVVIVVISIVFILVIWSRRS